MLKKIYIVLLILLFSSFIYGDNCKASNHIDIFNKLLESTDSQILEIGLKAEYKTDNDGEIECRKLLNNLDLDQKTDVLINNNQSFYVEFTKENFLGYIESIKSESGNVIVINIIKKTEENDLNAMEEKIASVIQSRNVKIKLFKYVKAKLEEKDLRNLNEKLLKVLKGIGSENVDSLCISNGYSTVVNTNMFTPEVCDGKLIDLNYVLCNYSSGDYIIIGTPEISTSY